MHDLKIFTSMLLFAIIFMACNKDENTPAITGADLHSTIDHHASQRIMIPDTLMMEEEIKIMADTILWFLKEREYGSIPEYIHPEKGIRLVPSGYIDTSHHQRFSPTAFKAIEPSSDHFLWGIHDGSGDSIYMTLNKFISEFLYSQPYKKADSVAIDQRLGQGNSINNIELIYPDAHFIEYHFGGFDKRYQGMDWSSLRLVFERYIDKWYLVALIHDQWTI